MSVTQATHLKAATLIYQGPNAHVMNVDKDESSETNSKKRSLSSPDTDVNKRYIFNSDTLLTQNRFYKLQNTQENTQENSSESQHRTKESTSTEAPKIPPIVLPNGTHHQNIIKDIKEVLKKDDFSTTYKGTQLRINLSSPEDYRELTKFYDQNKVSYYTYQSPEKANISAIIRNVPISITEDEIKAELLQLKYPVIKATRLLNTKKIPIPLIAIELQKTEEAKAIFNLNRLLHCVVAVEPRRKSSEIPQCTNCQRMGHTKNYCHLPPRCVKCKEHHHYSQCLKPKDVTPGCVNCGGEHTANYGACPYIKSFNRNFPQRNHPTQNTPRIKPINPNAFITGNITANRTYAENVANKTYDTQSTTNHNPIITNIIHTILELLTPYIDQIKTAIMSILPMLFNGGK